MKMSLSECVFVHVAVCVCAACVRVHICHLLHTDSRLRQSNYWTNEAINPFSKMFYKCCPTTSRTVTMATRTNKELTS